MLGSKGGDELDVFDGADVSDPKAFWTDLDVLDDFSPIWSCAGNFAGGSQVLRFFNQYFGVPAELLALFRRFRKTLPQFLDLTLQTLNVVGLVSIFKIHG